MSSKKFASTLSAQSLFCGENASVGSQTLGEAQSQSSLPVGENSTEARDQAGFPPIILMIQKADPPHPVKIRIMIYKTHSAKTHPYRTSQLKLYFQNNYSACKSQTSPLNYHQIYSTILRSACITFDPKPIRLYSFAFCATCLRMWRKFSKCADFCCLQCAVHMVY